MNNIIQECIQSGWGNLRRRLKMPQFTRLVPGYKDFRYDIKEILGNFADDFNFEGNLHTTTGMFGGPRNGRKGRF